MNFRKHSKDCVSVVVFHLGILVPFLLLQGWTVKANEPAAAITQPVKHPAR